MATIDLTSVVSGIGQGANYPYDRGEPWFILKKTIDFAALTTAGYTLASDDTYSLFDLPENVCITACWIDVTTVESGAATAKLEIGDSKDTNGLLIEQVLTALTVRGYEHDSTAGAAYLDGDTTAANGRWYCGMDSETAASSRIIIGTASIAAFTNAVVDVYVMGFKLV